ncbi:MAG: hypothetical protein GEV03_21780 [Streptosporangiales bacterium]|nr:hypothetical protein [Streptosporangiales bacterium]
MNEVALSRWQRWAAGLLGLASWAVGGTGAFLARNDFASVALIVLGAAAVLTALIGRLPSRLRVGGHELSYQAVTEVIDQKIENVPEPAVAVLEDLKRDLASLVPRADHPVTPPVQFDAAVSAALRRVLPAAEIHHPEVWTRDEPDFVVEVDGKTLLVETRYVRPNTGPYRGWDLGPLLQLVRQGRNLLVITNDEVAPEAHEVVAVTGADGRARVMHWLGMIDDDSLAEAVGDLLG